MTRTTNPEKRNLFSERLKELIKEAGKTQAAIADGINKMNAGVSISRQALNSYLQGDASPDIQRFKVISDYFDVSYDYMLGVTDNRKRETTNIAEKTGLSDSSYALLVRYMNEESEEKRRKFRTAINTFFSSKPAIDALVEFFSINKTENPSPEKYACISRDTDSGTESFDLASDSYAAFWLTNIQNILESLRKRNEFDYRALMLPEKSEAKIPTKIADIGGGLLRVEHPEE